MTDRETRSGCVSRRGFLVAGCTGIAVATLCSGAGLIGGLRAEPYPVDRTTFTYGGANGQKVLVAYTTATGSTVDIAAAIGETLGNRGYAVDVVPIQGGPPVAEYEAVLVGSPVHGGNWLPAAIAYVRDNQPDLGRLPLALFAVHAPFGGDDASTQSKRRVYLDKVRPFVSPATEGYFAGRFDNRTLAIALPRWLARLCPTFDGRNYDRIRAWAERVFT